MKLLRYLPIIFLTALLLAIGCGGKSPTAVQPPPTQQDPAFTVIERMGFDTLYPIATVRLALTIHVEPDSGNLDPGIVGRADETYLSVVNGTCANIGSGNNSTGGRFHFVVTVVPRYRVDSVPVGPTYRADLQPFPNPIPFPAPWGLDPDHLLLWKLKLTDASATAPAVLSFQLDTISTARLISRDFRDTGCQSVLP